MAETLLFTARCSQSRFSFFQPMLGGFQRLGRSPAGLFQRFEALLYGGVLPGVTGKRLLDLGYQWSQFALTDKSMALRRQLLEQSEDAPGVCQIFLFFLSLGELPLGSVTLFSQARHILQPLALLFERFETLLQVSKLGLLLLSLYFERLTRFGVHRLHTTGLLLQGGKCFAGAFGCFERGLAQTTVEAGVGEFFQQRAAVVVIGLEEGGKLALRQQHGTGELRQGEPEFGFEQLFEFPFLAAGQQLVAVQVEQALAAGLQLAVDLFPCALDLPAGTVAVAVDANEIHLGIAVGATAAQQVAFIAAADLVLAVRDLAQ